LPSLENLHQYFKDKPFRYYAIDVGEDKKTVQDFLKDKGMSFNNLFDTDAKISREYGVRSHPMKFLINADGKLIGTAGGYREWDTDEVKALISVLVTASKLDTPRF